eukprot:TRINITY_DN15879_c0_g1_i1.p1 TRINITY_DN15879_c0_g1~~TRINITY_DN15879_c0_g1_i1.p1  ORF type:complete len:685 (+),score=229.48 TRINITY_DN15879_c0_g1_i1:254-2056(+)
MDLAELCGAPSVQNAASAAPENRRVSIQVPEAEAAPAALPPAGSPTTGAAGGSEGSEESGEGEKPDAAEEGGMFVDTGGDSDSVSSFSTEDTSLGAAVMSDDDVPEEGEPAIRRQAEVVKRAKSRSRSRSYLISRSTTTTSSSHRPSELATTVPESELLDMHRMDVSKVVGVHRHYDGSSVPHYLAGAFDEGPSASCPDTLPEEKLSELIPFAKVVKSFTNHSKKKDSADIIKYCIYTAEKDGDGIIIDASSIVYLASGKVLGRVSCLFGPIEEPSYVVQDCRTEPLEEDDADPSDAVAQCAEGDLLYTRKDDASLLYEPPVQPLSHGATALDVLSKLHTKGCDASFLGDDELPVERQEFSDDEKEREARAERKRRRAEGAAEGEKIGLMDMLPEPDLGSSSGHSDFEFNAEGEIVARVEKAAKLRKKRPRVPLVPPTPAASSFRPPFIPPPPQQLRGDPKKVYVQDIPQDVAWHQLAAIMGASFGPVEEAVVAPLSKKQRRSGTENPKMFGFVTFKDEMAGKQAVFVGKARAPDGSIMRINVSRAPRIFKEPEPPLTKRARVEPALPPRESVDPMPASTEPCAEPEIDLPSDGSGDLEL